MGLCVVFVKTLTVCAHVRLSFRTRLHGVVLHHMCVRRDGNGVGSGRVAPIPTPPRLFKIIPIPVTFKNLNGAGRAGRV